MCEGGAGQTVTVDYGPLTSAEHGNGFSVILTLRHASTEGCRYHRATVIFFMCIFREPRPSLRPLRTSMASLAATEILGSWTGGGVTPPADTPLVFDGTCGSWTANTSEETGATIRARLRSFESTSTWGGLPRTAAIRYTILIRVWITGCSGRFQLIRAAWKLIRVRDEHRSS
jgi:hypothetical protein